MNYQTNKTIPLFCICNSKQKQNREALMQPPLNYAIFYEIKIHNVVYVFNLQNLQKTR